MGNSNAEISEISSSPDSLEVENIHKPRCNKVSRNKESSGSMYCRKSERKLKKRTH